MKLRKKHKKGSKISFAQAFTENVLLLIIKLSKILDIHGINQLKITIKISECVL